MKGLLFMVFCMVAFTACSDNYVNGVSPGDSSMGGGWWLIPVIGLGGGIALFLQGKRLAAKGNKWRDAKGEMHYDGVPQPWYKHVSGIGGALLIVATVIATIVRIATFN